MFTRPLCKDGGQTREVMPGDILAGGEKFATLATNGSGTITGALIAAGIINRTTVGAGYTDTPDTASNIIAALAGNQGTVTQSYGGPTTVTVLQGQPNCVPGSTMRLIFRNTVAQAMTFGTGVEGITYGSNVDVAASLVREYLITILNSTPRVSLQCTNTNASKTITLSTPQPMGTITPGMWISGTNITSGTLVLGVTLNGSGLISAVTTDTDSTGANATSVAMVFSPNVRIEGLRSSTL